MLMILELGTWTQGRGWREHAGPGRDFWNIDWLNLWVLREHNACAILTCTLGCQEGSRWHRRKTKDAFLGKCFCCETIIYLKYYFMYYFKYFLQLIFYSLKDLQWEGHVGGWHSALLQQFLKLLWPLLFDLNLNSNLNLDLVEILIKFNRGIFWRQA